MTFLAPLFLLGALAVVGPIIFHLIRRTTKDQTPFSSLMFLRPTPPRVTRRSRLENWWLLLLRCLILALLALGFARPLYQNAVSAPEAGPARKRTVLLVDTSASMRRPELWDQAKAKIEARVNAAGLEDEIAVVAFSRQTSPVVSFDQWRTTPISNRPAAVMQRLTDLQPGWSGTALGSALLQAAELLDQGREATAADEIVVVSDLQEGARLEGVQGFGWPKGVRVVLDPVTVEIKDQAGLQWLADAPAGGESARTLRIRVQNGATSRKDQFRLQWQPGAPADGIDVYVPAGQTRVAQVPLPPAGAERLTLTGDGVDFDNAVHILPPQPSKLSVLFAGKDAPADPQGALYYLRRGFPTTAGQIVELLERPPDPAPPAYELQRAQMLVLGEGVTEATVSAAREFAKSGRIVLYPVATAAAGPALSRLLETPSITLQEAKGREYSLFGQIDFTHPVFAPFADPRYSDFTKIRFWKHRVISAESLPAGKVLARFDDQSPALIQVPVGKGSVVVLMTTWRPADSQLALSSKFVPLLFALLEQSSGLPPQQSQYTIGDPVPLPPAVEPWKVRSPSGKEIAVEPGGRFTATEEPGIYSITPGAQRFVVNLPAEESRLAALEPARLSALGVPLESPGVEAAAKEAKIENPEVVQAMEAESRQKLWRWLLLGALVVLLLETPIAARLSRTPPTTAST